MINDIPRVIVAGPDTIGPVAGVTAGSAVGAQSGNSAAQSLPIGTEAPPPAQIVEERRQFVRRAEERRKQQLQVLIDTRVSQRRGARRRTVDEPPPSIDVEA